MDGRGQRQGERETPEGNTHIANPLAQCTTKLLNRTVIFVFDDLAADVVWVLGCGDRMAAAVCGNYRQRQNDSPTNDDGTTKATTPSIEHWYLDFARMANSGVRRDGIQPFLGPSPETFPLKSVHVVRHILTVEIFVPHFFDLRCLPQFSNRGVFRMRILNRGQHQSQVVFCRCSFVVPRHSVLELEERTAESVGESIETLAHARGLTELDQAANHVLGKDGKETQTSASNNSS